ncbi:MAG TPA: hypothetical protein VFS21_02515 [Roseiflexaceae bacterium]|nr:hypothetical protein [Roseiflexaceae bacterium]
MVQIGGVPAYFEAGTQRPNGMHANRVLRLIRSGVLIAIRSETLSKADLVAIAAALEPVPGSKLAPARAIAALPAIPSSPGPQLSPADIEAIKRAIAAGSSAAPEYQVVLQAVQGDFVHVLLVPNDPATEQMPVHLQRQGGQWSVVASGYAPPDAPMWQTLPEEWRPQGR